MAPKRRCLVRYFRSLARFWRDPGVNFGAACCSLAVFLVRLVVNLVRFQFYLRGLSFIWCDSCVFLRDFWRGLSLIWCDSCVFLRDFWCDRAISVRSCALKLNRTKFYKSRQIFYPGLGVFGRFRSRILDFFRTDWVDFRSIKLVQRAKFVLG